MEAGIRRVRLKDESARSKRSLETSLPTSVGVGQDYASGGQSVIV